MWLNPTLKMGEGVNLEATNLKEIRPCGVHKGKKMVKNTFVFEILYLFHFLKIFQNLNLVIF